MENLNHHSESAFFKSDSFQWPKLGRFAYSLIRMDERRLSLLPASIQKPKQLESYKSHEINEQAAESSAFVFCCCCFCFVFLKQYFSFEDIRPVGKLRILKRCLVCGLRKILGMQKDMVPFPQWLRNSLTCLLQGNFTGEKLSDSSIFGLLQFVILSLSFWKVLSFDLLWLIVEELDRLLALCLLLKVRLIKS